MKSMMSISEEEEEVHDIHWKYGVLIGTVQTIREMCDVTRFNAWQFYRDVERLVNRDIVEEALEYG